MLRIHERFHADWIPKIFANLSHPYLFREDESEQTATDTREYLLKIPWHFSFFHIKFISFFVRAYKIEKEKLKRILVGFHMTSSDSMAG